MFKVSKNGLLQFLHGYKKNNSAHTHSFVVNTCMLEVRQGIRSKVQIYENKDAEIGNGDVSTTKSVIFYLKATLRVLYCLDEGHLTQDKGCVRVGRVKLVGLIERWEIRQTFACVRGQSIT